MNDFAYGQRKFDSISFTASLDWRGRITIPAQTRRELGLKFRDIVLVSSIKKEAIQNER